MKKHEIIFSTIKLPLDFIIIFASFFIAREIRLMTDLIPGINIPVQTIDIASLFDFALFGAFLYIGLFISHQLYQSRITSSKIGEFLDIIRYGVYWFIFFSVFVFLGKGYIYSDAEIPRLVIFFTFIIGTIGVIFERIILNNIQYYLLRHKIISKKKIILINNKKLSEIKEVLRDIKKAKVYQIVGYMNKTEIKKQKKGFSFPFLGGDNNFISLFKKHKFDEILYIDSDFNKQELFHLWDLSRIFGVRYRYITNSFDITKTNTTLSLINNLPVLEIRNTALGIWGRAIKRLFDLIVSIFLIIILSPLLIITAFLIKISDVKAPVIYKNTRVGQNGKIFHVYKFRYMKWKYCIKDSYGIKQQADQALKIEQELIKKKNTRKGPLYKIKDDPRKTKIGNIIENYSIDELPQLFNVILGNMSLVGPRPHQPREVEKYSLYQKRLLTIKPGMTGMSQVNGREKNTFDDEANLDIFYIENWSILLDLKIILKTIPVIFKK